MSGQQEKGPKAEQTERPDLFDKLRQLSLRATEEFFELKQRMNELTDELDATPLSGANGSGISNKPRPERGDLVYEAVRLQLELANQMLDLGKKQTDFWIDRAQRFGSSVTKPARRVPVRLKSQIGRGGETARWGPLHVYNARRTDAPLELVVTKWRPSALAPKKSARRLHADPKTVHGRSNVAITVSFEAPVDLGPGTHVIEVDVELHGRQVGRLELKLVVDTK